MKDVNEVNGKELKEAIKGFNAILPKEQVINTFGMTKVDMLKAFAEKVEMVASDLPELVKKIPQEVVNFYNENVSESAEAKEQTEEAVTKAAEPEKKAEKPKKEKKEKKPKKEKVAKPDNVNRFGRHKNSRYGKMDELLEVGATIDSLKTMLMKDFNVDEKRAASQVKGHMRDVKKRKEASFLHDEATGVFKFTEYKEDAAAEN